MKISFDVPAGFIGCGITMVFENENGVNMYSTTITPDEVAGDKVLTLPRKEKQNEDNA